MTDNRERPVIHCSFCGKSQNEVAVIIAGPTVFICDKCVALCSDVVNENLSNRYFTCGHHIEPCDCLSDCSLDNLIGTLIHDTYIYDCYVPELFTATDHT